MVDNKSISLRAFFISKYISKSKTKSFSKSHKNIIICESMMDALNNLLIYKPSWTIDFATSISKKNYIRKLILLIFFSFFFQTYNI